MPPSNNQVEDLLLDIENLEIKNEILTSDNKVLAEELKLARSLGVATISSDCYEQAYNTVSDELRDCRSKITVLVQKYAAVMRHLALEKRALYEIRCEANNMSAYNMKAYDNLLQFIKTKETSDKEEKATLFVTGETLRHKIDNLTTELNDKKAMCLSLADSIESQKSGMESERESYNTRVEAITGKIDQLTSYHKSELESIRRNIADAEAARALVAAENSKLLLQLEDLRRVNNEQRERLQIAEEVSATAENMLTAVQGTSAACLAENNDLKLRLMKTQEQFQRLSESNDALQADFQSVVRREEAIRKMNSNDKDDLHGRLRNIQEKVRSMEQDRDEEMGRLKELLQVLELDRDKALREKEAATQSNRDCEHRFNGLKDQLLQKEEELKALQTDSLKRTEALTAQVKAYQRTISDLEASREALRQDVDSIRTTLDERSAALKSTASTLKNTESSLKSLEEEKEVLQRKWQSVSEEAAQLRSEIAKSSRQQQGVSEKEEEIFQLKETIRRECEERTEMLIEISMLRDSLLQVRGLRRQQGLFRRHLNNIISSTARCKGEAEQYTPP